MPEDLKGRAVAVPRTLVALGAGLLTFAVLSSLRLRVQYLAPQPPAVALLTTLLAYFGAGFTTGLFLLRGYVLTGGALGLLTVGVVWLELPLRERPLALADLLTALFAFAALGVMTCATGCAAAGRMRAHRAGVIR